MLWEWQTCDATFVHQSSAFSRTISSLLGGVLSVTDDSALKYSVSLQLASTSRTSILFPVPFIKSLRRLSSSDVRPVPVVCSQNSASAAWRLNPARRKLSNLYSESE